MRKLTRVTLDDVLEIVSKLEPEKFILIVQPTTRSRSLEYLKGKLGLDKLTEGVGALFFRATFHDLKEARDFVAEHLSDDNHWQELALGIYLNGKLLWEGLKR